MEFLKPKISTRAVYREKGSKFIACLHPADNENEVQAILSALRSAFPDANHHCYAYRLQSGDVIEYAQDDGEPSGTAGLPILNALRSNNLANSLLVVVRYFGGTKLGKGGLIQAYGDSATLAISESDLLRFRCLESIIIQYPYNCSKQIEIFLNRFGATVMDSSYDEQVEQRIALSPDSLESALSMLDDLVYLGLRYKLTGSEYTSIQDEKN